MKIITPELETHLEGEVTTLATCWKLLLRNATILGFTDHNHDIVFESTVYLARTGFTPSEIESGADLSEDSLSADSILDAESITEEDILAGIYDFAEIEIFKVNYSDLSSGALKLRRGWLGEVSLNQHRFTAEIRGLTQKLFQNIGELYSPSCRANFADSRCTVSAAAFTVSGTITAVTSNAVFSDALRTEAVGYFSQGLITFTSGNNSGISMEVKDYFPTSITLVFPMPFAVQVGDAYSMLAGCDKTFETCKTRYNNAINFRGEPFIPGLDRVLETSSTRSI